MGYRELLKKYIRFVESQAGDDFIDAAAYAVDRPFSDREVGELKALAVERAPDGAVAYARLLEFSYRFRLLCLAFDLTLERAAGMAGVDATVVRHWRANPLSSYYVAMQEAEFVRFERALVDWLTHRHRDADAGARRLAMRSASGNPAGRGKKALS